LDGVPDGKAPTLRFGENRAERDGDPFDDRRRPAGFTKAVLKIPHPWYRRLVQLHIADEGLDVQLKVLAALVQRCALEAGGLAALQPELSGLRDGDRLRIGDVHAGGNLALSGDQKGLGVLLLENIFRRRFPAAST